MSNGAHDAVVVASVNVNGLRAAARNGMATWVAHRQPQVITMQEVRAPDALVVDLVAEVMGDGWHVVHAESSQKGRAGVAIASRFPILEWRTFDDEPCFRALGRWIEADIECSDGAPMTVVSVYVHTGDETSPERMTEKLAFLEAMTNRMEALRTRGVDVLITGDLNVAHREVDLKNWKGNLTSAGFLPEERAFFDRWFVDLGWVDVTRNLSGDQPGPYTWWSFRGRAFDNDAGWRIDYHLATPALAERALFVAVDRAATYDARWSDHAPVVVGYRP
jgi:exodeoxyribonuclease-3